MTSPKPTIVTLLSIPLAGALLFAGCSSDDSSNEGAAASSESVEAGDATGAVPATEAAPATETPPATEAAPAATPEAPAASAQPTPAPAPAASAPASTKAASGGSTAKPAAAPAAAPAPAPASGSGQKAPAPSQAGATAPAPATAAAAAPGGATDVGVSDKEIKMGGIYMYGMPLAKLFIPPIYRAVNSVIRVTNDQGGIHGRKITHIDCDDGTPDPARTRACYKKLVEQDKIFAFIGGATFVQGELMPQVAKDQIPWVAPVSLYKAEWENPWVFPTHMAMEHEGIAAAGWVAKHHKPKKFGLLCLNTPEMQATCKAAGNVLRATGAQLVHQTNTDVTTADLSGEILAMRAADPEVILHFTVHPAATARFMVDAAQQNYWPSKGMVGNHMAFEAVGGLIGEHPTKGYWTNSTYKVWGPDFISYMRKHNPDNEGLNHHVLQGQWFGAVVAMEAMKELGPNLTRAGLKQVLESRLWDSGPGLGNKFLWQMAQRNNLETGNRSQYMYKYVSPETRANDQATAKGLIPAPEQFEIKAEDLNFIGK